VCQAALCTVRIWLTLSGNYGLLMARVSTGYTARWKMAFGTSRKAKRASACSPGGITFSILPCSRKPSLAPFRFRTAQRRPCAPPARKPRSLYSRFSPRRRGWAFESRRGEGWVGQVVGSAANSPRPQCRPAPMAIGPGTFTSSLNRRVRCTAVCVCRCLGRI